MTGTSGSHGEGKDGCWFEVKDGAGRLVGDYKTLKEAQIAEDAVYGREPKH